MWLYVSPKSHFAAHFDGSSFLLAIDERNLLPIKWKEHGESKIHVSHQASPFFFLSLAQYFMRARDSSKEPLFAPRARPFDLSFRLFPCKRCVSINLMCSESLYMARCVRTWRAGHDSFNFFSLSHRREIEYIWAWPSSMGCGHAIAASWPQNNLIYALLTIKLTS